MVFVAYAWPFVVGALFLWLAFFYFRKQKYKASIVFGIIAALFVLAPFPWWVFFAFLGALGLWWWGRMARFARDRNAVMRQTGEKWYRYASEEVFSNRGQHFLLTHFAETLLPDRAPTWNKRMLARVAALGAYLRIIEEKGSDATHYDTLPVDEEAVSQARVLSRVAIRSWLAKDNIPF